jgi:hypothetical protein
MYLRSLQLLTVVQRSTCTSHNAVNDANTRDSRGKDATGVGAVDCARHGMKRPCSVGDLQKGERWVVILPTDDWANDILAM